MGPAVMHPGQWEGGAEGSWAQGEPASQTAWGSCSEHPAQLSQVGKAPSTPPGGRQQPALLCAPGFRDEAIRLALSTTAGIWAICSVEGGAGSPLSLLSPGLPKLQLRHANHSLLLYLVIDPLLPCNLGLVLICQGLKARRDGQAGVLSLVSGQRLLGQSSGVRVKVHACSRGRNRLYVGRGQGALSFRECVCRGGMIIGLISAAESGDPGMRADRAAAWS